MPKEIRPASSHTTRQLLVHHGLQIARASGLRSITVRQVCSLAEANTGTFVYHFGTREKFIGELVERWYEPLFAQMQLVVDGGTSPFDRLEGLLQQMLAFVDEHGAFIAQLVQDAAAGEKAASKFASSLPLRHPILFLQCIVDAQNAGQIVLAPPTHVMLFLVSALGLPALMQHMLSGVLPPHMLVASQAVASGSQNSRLRLQWALNGLRPRSRQ